MRYAFVSLAFGLGANAYVARANTQCFKLSASGGASGVLGQLDDGQNRVGGGHPTGCYCLDGNGGFTDSNGRGCILTPPTTQFQCDVGATPTNGFAVSSSGSVTYNGSGKFYACPVNENGEYNVYTTPAPGQTKCVEITLGSAGSCGAGASQPAGSQPSATTPASTTVVSKSKPAETPVGTPSVPASQPAPKPSGPAPEAPKSSQPPAQPPQPSPSAPDVPQESACVPKVVTVTVTQPLAPPVETNPAPPKPAESKPASPLESEPAPPASQPTTSKPAATVSAPSAPAPSKPAASGTCPQDLNGNYQYPHLIVPVDSEQPDKAYGTSYNGTISAHICTIFNFDIPASYAGKKCSTMFMLPKKEDLETSDYTISSQGKCTVSKVNGNANTQTTWNNAPAKAGDIGSLELSPGNTYPVESGDCEAGKTVSYEICGSGDFSINYFQDYNPSPIGLYVRQC
ncbi:hypothetical protein ACET3X_003729 [Alternaria dauci]|uniref:Ubiquitin 3 binding protein But2 C-terminal domain-containing protein n=1 Tax=Alternaria dauci TaxID=48095 RepID=A0ABR3UKX8_9PLEO